ncbi:MULTISPECIES: ABC transporter permease [Corynebacterium]|uniref:ABC transporter permease n=1 Tax=Corynebacterium TaxID=1716 RepID=UPI0011849001|nr:ABC transporter permease [Corynebacterium guaraldiae]TRX54723.1 ABC transporter permease [Corynebacterium guaraldiae]
MNSRDADGDEESWEEPSKVILVDDSTLLPLESRPHLSKYLKDLIARRHFIVADAKSRAFAPNRDMWLGRAWLIIRPLLDAAMYGLIFGLMLKTNRGIDNFVGYLVLGITYFGLITGLMGQGNGFIRSQRSFISAFRFPRAALVISAALRNVFDAIPTMVVGIVMALALQWGTPLSPTIPLVIPLTVIVALFGTGMFFLVAWITAWVPDAKYFVSLFSRAWFFISGVFFSIERFVDHPTILKIMLANPAYQYLTAIREVVMYGQVPSLRAWGILLAVGLGTFVFGFICFWSSEAKYTNVR